MPQLISQDDRGLLHCRAPNDETGAGKRAGVMSGFIRIGICHQDSFYTATQHSGRDLPMDRDRPVPELSRTRSPDGIGRPPEDRSGLRNDVRLAARNRAC